MKILLPAGLKAFGLTLAIWSALLIEKMHDVWDGNQRIDFALLSLFIGLVIFFSTKD